MSFGGSLGYSETNSTSELQSTMVATGLHTDEGYETTSGTKNSGRTDTASTKAGNSTVNSGSTNSTINSGSINDTVNSGSINTTTTGPSQNVTNQSSSTFNSGRVDTSQVILTQEATDRLIQQMLEGNQGLQAVTSGQRTVGGYDSSAAQMLTDDLLARTAGEIAVRGAKTVNTIGSSSSTTSGTTVENRGAVTSTQNIGGSTSRQSMGGSTSTQNIGGSRSDTSAYSDAINILGESESNTLTSVGRHVITDYATEQKNVKEEKEETKTEVKVETSLSVICTAAYKEGKIPSYLYVRSSTVFRQFSATERAGYYIWAVPAVAYMERNPTSFLTRVLYRIAIAATNHLSQSPIATITDHSIYFVGRVVCWTLARVLSAIKLVGGNVTSRGV